MDVDIHSTIFQPLGEGEPYLVVVSALPVDQRSPPRRWATHSSAAYTYADAMARCEELARRLLERIAQFGDGVRTVHCRWNPGCSFCTAS
jgi:hypothetical protein